MLSPKSFNSAAFSCPGFRGMLISFRRNMHCYLFVGPAVTLMLVFSAAPFLWALGLSLFKYSPGQSLRFVGLDNLAACFQDPILRTAMSHVALLVFVAVLARVTVPVLVARIIFSLRSERERHFYRLAFLIPMMFPMTAVMLIWAQVIYSDSGLINQFLNWIGQTDLTRGWLSDPSSALWAIAMVGFPFASGFDILIYYAAFSNVPDSIHDAAVIDGAGVLSKFFAVELPMILSQIRMLVILAVIGALQGFEVVLILTSGMATGSGGPGFKTMVPGLWMYINAFLYQDLGYACAIGTLLFVLIMGLTLLNLKVIKSTSEVQA